MARRRLALYVLLALCLPLPAHALTRGSEEPAALAVEATLDHCGLLDTQVVCIIDVAYSTLPEATGYKASVTRADGSVVDYGDVPAGGTSLWVAYAGSGTYSVQISAYGEPSTPGGRPPLLDEDESGTGAGRVEADVDPAENRDRRDPRGTARSDQGDGTGETQAPSCEQPDSEEEQVDDSASEDEAAEPEEEGEQSVDCPREQP